MKCPVCRQELPLLAEVLARTNGGTQCPKCWTRLRREGKLVEFRSREGDRRRKPQRRAA